ncbi:hypothetical protein [Neobacillus mesonae]|uniref:hypothetical protein n=1 Tax=Neobacillus mesonae TaxID=1193713 RepID=UPI000835B1C2|nr:hypothetical protein [Neobacillus mesonae]
MRDVFTKEIDIASLVNGKYYIGIITVDHSNKSLFGILSTSGSWYKVKYGTKTVYVSKAYIK